MSKNKYPAPGTSIFKHIAHIIHISYAIKSLDTTIQLLVPKIVYFFGFPQFYSRIYNETGGSPKEHTVYREREIKVAAVSSSNVINLSLIHI